MRKYKTVVRIVFVGDVEVIANNKVEAKEIVENNFWATLGNTGSNDEEAIPDWSITTHSENIQVLTVNKLNNER